MDYKKAYKEALKKAQGFIKNDPGHILHEDDIKSIFKELQGTDENVINRCIEAIEFAYVEGEVRSKCIAWLNEQKGKDKLIQELGEYKTKYIQEVIGQYLEKERSKPTTNYTGESNVWNNAQDFRPKHLQRCLCYDKYMHGVYCYVYDNISKYWCTHTTEEHDPDGENHICDYADYRVTIWMELPTTEFYPKEIRLGFNVGDWIVHTEYGTVHQVKSRECKDGSWYYVLEDGELIHYTNEYAYHTWTIYDAKDGDALVASDKSIFLYRKSNDSEAKFYAAMTIKGDIVVDDGIKHLEFNKACHPATEEQRNAIFDRLEEKGYAWNPRLSTYVKNDNNAKGTKQEDIQCTPRDETMINAIIRSLEYYYQNYIKVEPLHDIVNQEISWLHSILSVQHK